MTKEVTLNISERVAASQILNTFKGDLTQLTLLLADMKNIAVTSEEWTKADLKKTPIPNEKGEPSGQESWNWNDKPELDKEITLDPETKLFIQTSIKDMENKKEITMANVALITLKTKLQ